MKPRHSLSPIAGSTRFILAAAILGELTFSACGRKSPVVDATMPVPPPTRSAGAATETTTIETIGLRAAMETFEKNPTAENQSSVNLIFTKLDGEILELQNREIKTHGAERAEASEKVKNLLRYRGDEMIRFEKIKDTVAMNAAPSMDSRSGAQKVGDTVAMAGEKVADGTRTVGKSIRTTARNTGEAIKDATH